MMKGIYFLLIAAYLAITSDGINVSADANFNTSKIFDLLPKVNLTQIAAGVRPFANKVGSKTQHAVSYLRNSTTGKIDVTFKNGTTISIAAAPKPVLGRLVDTAVDTNNNSIIYTLRAREDNVKYVERFYVSTKPVPIFRAAFFVNSTTTVDYFRFRTAMHRLVEFNDLVDVQSSVNVFSFANLNWPAWTTETKMDDSNNATIYNLTSTVNPSGSFRITLEAIITANTSAVVYGTPLVPSMIKYNIRIVNYPYALLGSRLAIVKTLVTRTIDANITADQVNSVSVGDGGRFSWASNVSLSTATGSSATTAAIGLSSASNSSASGFFQVTTDLPDADETAKVLVYKINAVQPAYVFWDPSNTVNEDEMSQQQAVASAGENSGSSTLHPLNVASILAFALLALTLNVI